MQNRRLAELLGIPYFPATFGLNVASDEYPDFAADPRLVLREMESRPDGKLFFAWLMYHNPHRKNEFIEAIDDDGLIERRYMTDQTGLLRDRAIEWLERGK